MRKLIKGSSFILHRKQKDIIVVHVAENAYFTLVYEQI